MKTREIKKTGLMLLIAIFITSFTLSAQEHSNMHNHSKTEKKHDHSKMEMNSKTLKINAPTVQCNMCKKRIEKQMKKVEGVVSTNVDYKKKVITVEYNPETTTPDKIRKVISKIGYQADNVKADKKAYDKLPSCCKVPDKKK